MTRLFGITVFLSCFFLSSAFAQKNSQLGHGKEQKLATLEAKVTSLEQRALDLKANVEQISAKIFGGQIRTGKARVSVRHLSKLGGAFRVSDITYWLGSKKIYENKEKPKKRIPTNQIIYQSPLEPGRYMIRVVAKVRGHGFGVFTYMKKYKLTLSKEVVFRMYTGRELEVQIEFKDNGNKDLRKRVELNSREIKK